MKPSTKLRHLVNKFTREIKQAHKKTLKHINKYTITSKSIHLISQVDLTDIKNNSFLDDTIQHHIINNSNHIKQLIIEKVKITIVDEYPISDKYFYYISVWLNFILPYADKSCIKPLHIKIFLTPFKKLLPANSQVIGPYNVNSGSTRVCTANSSSILIWRKEEWFKVLIHESFHYFQLDKHHHSRGASEMKKLFHIESDFLMGEVHSETWATILHSIFYAFYKKENVWHILQLERMHSIKQTIHILQHMDLTYDHIISRHTNKYKEQTNVFCYYIAKMICIYYINPFIKWCPTLTCDKPLHLFIKKYFNKPTLLKEIHKVKHVPYSLKMCHSSLDI
jgi:hypothetical protein